MTRKPDRPLRRGWTTGACATAATKAAYTALLTGEFPDPVPIRLPGGTTPHFALAVHGIDQGCARAGIVKDAGDDPDVTHQALILARLHPAAPGAGVCFQAGAGVGVVTQAGLPVEVGEPAINPVPRRMMREAIEEVAAQYGAAGDVLVEISVPGGQQLAQKTWNPRLGIVGGLSILGTTGIVQPYSCSAWIHSIRQGIDVAVAGGIRHAAASTGSTSEQAVQRLYQLPDSALLDMGDFAGAVLKYLRRRPIARLTIAGGFGKLTKLAQGFLDLHSGRSQVDFEWLAERVSRLGGDVAQVEAVRQALTAQLALQLATEAGIPLADEVARAARAMALETLGRAPVSVEVLIFDRKGNLVGRCDG